MVISRRSREAQALADVLDTRAPEGSFADLVGLADELRAAVDPHVSAGPSVVRRQELRAAVLARAREQQAAGAGRRLRGAALGLAAIAGGGLVVASAASGANPVVLVADAAGHLPLVPSYGAAPDQVAIEGEVIALRDEGRTIEVRTNDETVLVEAPADARKVTAEGTPMASADIATGSTVRVTGTEPKDGPLEAKRIEVVPPTLAVKPGPVDAGTSTVPSTPSDGQSAGVDTKPSATPTRTSTPKPAVNTTAVASDPVITEPPRTPTPKPKATAQTRPKATPTVAAVDPVPPDTSGSETAPLLNDEAIEPAKMDDRK